MAMDAVESLIIQHQDYVRSLARGIAKRLPRHVEFDELVSMGQVGLVTAAKQFEAGRGVAFATFAYYRIRGAIFDGLRQVAWLPPSAKREVARLGTENEVAEVTAESTELSDDPEFLAKQFETAVGRLGAVFLLSQSSAGEDGEADEGPAVERSAADEAEQKEAVELVVKAIASLPEEQRELIRMLYFENKSMTDVAQLLKKNKSTISRRHSEAIDALRAVLSGENPRAPVQVTVNAPMPRLPATMPMPRPGM
jgi:RNA polymerase sigma factor for flagellar operon FliA